MEHSRVRAADIAPEVVTEYRDKLTRSLLEAICKLDGPCREALWDAQAHTCLTTFFDLTALPAQMDLDAFLQAMHTAGTGQVDITREGDTIYWIERREGQCICPFVRLEVVNLNPILCRCSAHWVMHLLKIVTDTSVEVEVLDTVATGDESCSFRLTIVRDQEPADEVST